MFGVSARRNATARKADVACLTLDPPLEVKDTPRSDQTFHSMRESDREFDANHTWNPMECVIIRGMEDYFGRSETSRCGRRVVRCFRYHHCLGK